MEMNFTESYLQKLWLVHYEYREFDWGAVCKMVPESWMFLRYYKGSCPSIEIVDVPNCCGDGIDWLSFRHVHKDEFWLHHYENLQNADLESHWKTDSSEGVKNISHLTYCAGTQQNTILSKIKGVLTCWTFLEMHLLPGWHQKSKSNFSP